jgi:hypothetical protein
MCVCLYYSLTYLPLALIARCLTTSPAGTARASPRDYASQSGTTSSAAFYLTTGDHWLCLLGDADKRKEVDKRGVKSRKKHRRTII